MKCLTLTLPANIAINDISLKTRSFGLHFRCREYWCIFNHYRIFGEIMRRLRLLRRSRSSEVTEFGINRKLICDFLLVVNTNVVPILHRLRDIALDRSKIAYIRLYPLVFNSSDGGVPCAPGTISVKFYLDVNKWPIRIKWHRNIAINFSRLNRVHERYRQTDRR